MARITCTACKDVPGHQKHLCHECHGVGYTEVFPFLCNWFNNRSDLPKCPIESEPMVGGWLCNKCGRSGPL